MCVISMIGSEFSRMIPPAYPWAVPTPGVTSDAPSRAEFESLRHEMQELRKLLMAAKAYDEATGQADCEDDEKVALLKRLAELVGVDLSDVFGVPVSVGGPGK